jgi:hypothetical protein
LPGEFIDGQLIIGATSNARHILSSFDPLKDSTRNEAYDNQYIDHQPIILLISQKLIHLEKYNVYTSL